jgi:hypothetical protein
VHRKVGRSCSSKGEIMVSQYLNSVADVESIKKQVCDVINRATCSDSIEGVAFLVERFSDLLVELGERGFSVGVLFEQDETPDFVLREVELLVRTSIRLYQSRTTTDEKKAALALLNFAERKARHVGFQLAMMGDSGGLQISFRPLRPGEKLSPPSEPEPLAVAGGYRSVGERTSNSFEGAP